jgi:hypothetical protein
MSRSIVVGVLVALIVLVGLGSLGWVTYNAGVAQGLSESGKLALPASAGAAGVAPAYAYPHLWGYGLGPLGCLVPLFVILFFFMLFRMAFWGLGARRWGGFGHGPSFGRWDSERGVPPFFESWHKRAHGEAQEPSGREENAT